VRNPYDFSRTPGGSSGGTGASIAANFAMVGLGTDTMNSVPVRYPCVWVTLMVGEESCFCVWGCWDSSDEGLDFEGWGLSCFVESGCRWTDCTDGGGCYGHL
jgi:hypothetical protein